MKINKIQILLLSIFVVFAASFLLKPNWPVKVWDNIKAEHEEVDEQIQKEFDSIMEVRKIEKEAYKDSIEAYKRHLSDVSDKLHEAKKINKYNAKKLRDYRYNSYDDRFKLFTGLISETDTIPK